jgi:hypothetical protein
LKQSRDRRQVAAVLPMLAARYQQLIDIVEQDPRLNSIPRGQRAAYRTQARKAAQELAGLEILLRGDATPHPLPRVLCGAKCRDGGRCRALVMTGRTRCARHGGKSTGPRSEEGRAAIAQSNQRRAARKIAERGPLYSA